MAVERPEEVMVLARPKSVILAVRRSPWPVRRTLGDLRSRWTRGWGVREWRNAIPMAMSRAIEWASGGGRRRSFSEREARWERREPCDMSSRTMRGRGVERQTPRRVTMFGWRREARTETSDSRRDVVSGEIESVWSSLMATGVLA